MSSKLTNKNLTPHTGETFKGLKVNTKQTLAVEYLQRLHDVFEDSFELWNRVTVFHVTLTLPARGECVDDPAVQEDRRITRFIESFKAKLIARHERRLSVGKRTNYPDVHYAWAKERDSSINDHFHVFFLLDGDEFFNFGHVSNSENTIAAYIVQAWGSAAKIDTYFFRGLIEFNGASYVRKSADDYTEQRNDTFHWLSYIAKIETKIYGSKKKNFGCSRPKAKKLFSNDIGM